MHVVGDLERLVLLNDLNTEQSRLCLLDKLGPQRHRLLVTVQRLVILSRV